jgi:hypothetical protein
MYKQGQGIIPCPRPPCPISPAKNAGTLITGLAVLAIAGAIVIKLIKDKPKGKCYSCDCGGCKENETAALAGGGRYATDTWIS